jgi:hypothetical protein
MIMTWLLAWPNLRRAHLLNLAKLGHAVGASWRAGVARFPDFARFLGIKIAVTSPWPEHIENGILPLI